MIKMERFKYDINLYNTEKVGIMKRDQVLHYPRLDTILAVENTIRKSKEYPSKRQLWLSLPKKVMYQTFKIILKYLIDSGKIVIKDGKVIWIYNPELVKKYSESELIAR
jgi:hypothetical protein